MDNNVLLVGRLTKDLEIKEAGETKICRFVIAVNREFKNKDGEIEADFLPCVTFGKTAENLVKYCKKGDMIGVRGRLQQNIYVDGDGDKRYNYEVIVERLSYLAKVKGEESEK